MRFHFTRSCNELWAKRQSLPDTVRLAWMHSLPGDEPGQLQGFQGQGSWPRGLPRGSSASLPDCVFNLNGASNNVWVATLQELVANAHGQAVALFWMHVLRTLHLVIGVTFVVDVTKLETFWLRPPARRDWPHSHNKTWPLNGHSQFWVDVKVISTPPNLTNPSSTRSARQMPRSANNTARDPRVVVYCMCARFLS